ncbi:uncharacterized protein LOC111494494 [Cucurbita maxima]|uniref:Uncharacterized protein LOC111494494 n=1 Tax=Cucurbita maxima TaxID=3661 RepID=A0A6J1KJ83_CUCMA|nr:uncharacterized protein LOC111494494 [Cucurbita maxima]
MILVVSREVILEMCLRNEIYGLMPCLAIWWVEIRSKPGSKLEIREGSVVERYDRPMPKQINTDLKSSKYEDRTAPPGTLNVAQMRHIILLNEGKADDFEGPICVHQIAERCNSVSVHQIQTILQFLSLPPEDSLREKKKDP